MAEVDGGGGEGKTVLRTRTVADDVGSNGGLRAPRGRAAELALASGTREGKLSARKLGARLWKLQGMRLLNEMSWQGSSSSSSRRMESVHGSRATAEQLQKLSTIRRMEEQNIYSISAIKQLKIQLSHSQSNVQVMKHMQRASFRELQQLKTVIMEAESTTMIKEQNRTKAAVVALTEELQNERRLRRRTESFLVQISKELSEAKSACWKAMRDLDEQVKTNNVLVGLCD